MRWAAKGKWPDYWSPADALWARALLGPRPLPCDVYVHAELVEGTDLELAGVR